MVVLTMAGAFLWLGSFMEASDLWAFGLLGTYGFAGTLGEAAVGVWC